MPDIDDEGNLLTESGKKIPPLQFTPNLFLDRSTIINGPSKTGKTVIIKNAMKALTNHIEQVIVISPSEPMNRSYEGFVDPPFVHYRLYLADPANPKKDDGTRGALRFLDQVWKRQEMMAGIYTRANNSDVLSSLFHKLPNDVRKEGLKYIEEINKKRRHIVERVRLQYVTDAGRREEKIKEITEKFKKMLTLLYKKYIAPFYGELWACADLTDDERYSLNYLNFNPRLLLVFDDCAAELKPLFGNQIFRKLFYQNRHVFITLLISAQDDTDLPTNLRKNAFVTFFTEQIVCTSNFDRASNKFPKQTKQHVSDIIGVIFVGNRKLAYIREDDRRQHFYHVTLPYPEPFRFGSKASHELCDEVAVTGVSMDKENPYYERFKIN
jgi:hypothetical protein